MNKHLFSHVNIDAAKTHIPNGMADDPKKECREFEEKIAEALEKIAEYRASTGTTAFLPTLSSITHDELVRAVKRAV